MTPRSRVTRRAIALRRTILAALLLSGLATYASAQSRSAYRTFVLGSDVASILAAGDITSAGVRTLHAEPALLQELEWWPPHFIRGSTEPDTVEHVIFSFYNGRLFRLIVDYDHVRTEGMTSADMVASLSAVYGAVSGDESAAAPARGGAGGRIAVWADADHSVELYRSPYAYRLVLASHTMSVAAQAAETQALERVRRESAARQDRQAADDQAARDKAAAANKAAFRP